MRFNRVTWTKRDRQGIRLQRMKTRLLAFDIHSRVCQIIIDDKPTRSINKNKTIGYTNYDP